MDDLTLNILKEMDEVFNYIIYYNRPFGCATCILDNYEIPGTQKCVAVDFNFQESEQLFLLDMNSKIVIMNELHQLMVNLYNENPIDLTELNKKSKPERKLSVDIVTKYKLTMKVSLWMINK